jgi:ribosomal protein S12 methylthiotransferase accessory factor
VRFRDSLPKLAGQRVRSTEATFALVRPLFHDYGITRLADITGLDWIGIPVYNAIVPRSLESVSVYTGKGATALDSKVSAVMEALERSAALGAPAPVRTCSYNELSRAGERALRPAEINLELHPRYDDDTPVHWADGVDIRNEESIMVPHSAVTMNSPMGAVRCYRLVTANGLASGNCLEEAICHALAELIERDAQTTAEIVSVRLPHLLARDPGPDVDAAVRVLRDRNARIDPASVTGYGGRLLEMYDAAKVRVVLRSVTNDLNVTSVMAVADEDNATGMSRAHVGFGTCTDRDVAVSRALSECAQSRAVDIQAMREDFVEADCRDPETPVYGRRQVAVQRDAWPWDTSGPTLAMGDLTTYESDDIVADVRFMLDRLFERGLSRVIVSDLSPPGAPFAVARVIVPGLESWGSDRSRLGERATRAWNEAAQLVTQEQALAAATGATGSVR